jgi:hypothetical protein
MNLASEFPTGGPVRQTYARVDFIPWSGDKDLATEFPKHLDEFECDAWTHPSSVYVKLSTPYEIFLIAFNILYSIGTVYSVHLLKLTTLIPKKTVRYSGNQIYEFGYETFIPTTDC